MFLFSINSLCQCTGWNAHETSQTDLPSVTIQNHYSTGWYPDERYSDEFDGTLLDLNKWDQLPQGSCHGMSDGAYFKASNSYISNGKLILHTQHETQTICGRTYSSGWVGLKPRVRYGFIEIRCKMPSDYKQQPCFWLFGQDNGSYDEIDVNEYVMPNMGNKRMLHNEYRKRSYPPYTDTTVSVDVLFSHFNQVFTINDITFGVEWFPYELVFYVNGEVVGVRKYTTNLAQISPSGYPSPSEFTCVDFTNSITQWVQLSYSLLKPVPTQLEDFEIEYIRAFKLGQGNQGTFWPAFISVQDPQLSLVHNDIHIGGDQNHLGWFPWYSRINLWAENSITLDKSFEIDSHTDFTARVITTSTDCYLPNNQIINEY
jgi:hypothetical protein